MPGDIGQEAAKHAAVTYFTARNAAWPRALVQNIERLGPHYIVTIIPENQMGILLFMVSYKLWVNAMTGVVEKMK
jgi:hypothetical protein